MLKIPRGGTSNRAIDAHRVTRTRRSAGLRDQRFVTEHRGGPLDRERHRLLMTWACECTEHVLDLFGSVIDPRLRHALEVAKQWRDGLAPVGAAMKASALAHMVAREASNQTAKAVARSAGQAVATAHMADHSLGAAWYALKAVRYAGRSVEAERQWQDDRLPESIKALVLTGRSKKNI